MKTLPILLHPDPRLKKMCDPVTVFDTALQTFADDMLHTMYEAPGVGLAAPQVGVTKRIFVMDCTTKDEDQIREHKPMVLINPEITWSADETSVYNEGCLSLPDLYEDIERPASVKMRYRDVSGETHEETFEDLWSTCAQHELDHLDGILFIDYLTRMKRNMMTRKMEKYKKDLARG
jgi:peptide deformylase